MVARRTIAYKGKRFLDHCNPCCWSLPPLYDTKRLLLFLAFLLSQKLYLAQSLTLLDDQVQCYLDKPLARWRILEPGRWYNLILAVLPAFMQEEPARRLEDAAGLAGAWAPFASSTVHLANLPRILRKVVCNFSRCRARSLSRLSSIAAHGWTPVPWKSVGQKPLMQYCTWA